MASKKIKVLTPYFRASFLNVFKPRAPFEGKPPVYSVQMLFPKEADLGPLKKAALELIVEKWGSDKTKWPKGLRLPFKSGDEKNLENYKGMTVLECRSKQKPGLVNQKREDIIDETEIYSGCWMRATVTPFIYDVQGNRGVSFGLNSLQKVKDDTAFSGRSNAKDDFEELEELNDVDSVDLNSEIDF